MRVTQVVKTIQGEGLNLGKPCLLIRLEGCNLKCPWCDSKFTNKKNSGKEIDIVKLINDYNTVKHSYLNHIMITGGEPLLYQKEVNEIINSVSKNINFEIETNGLLLNDDSLLNNNVVYNISPKLDVRFYYKKQNIKSLKDIIDLYINVLQPKPNYTFKFVYKKEWENDILEFLNNFIISNEILIMPYFDKKEDFLKSNLDTIEFCIEYGYRYTPRQHIYLFGTDNSEYQKIEL